MLDDRGIPVRERRYILRAALEQDPAEVVVELLQHLALAGAGPLVYGLGISDDLGRRCRILCVEILGEGAGGDVRPDGCGIQPCRLLAVALRSHGLAVGLRRSTRPESHVCRPRRPR